MPTNENNFPIQQCPVQWKSRFFVFPENEWCTDDYDRTVFRKETGIFKKEAGRHRWTKKHHHVFLANNITVSKKLFACVNFYDKRYKEKRKQKNWQQSDYEYCQNKQQRTRLNPAQCTQEPFEKGDKIPERSNTARQVFIFFIRYALKKGLFQKLKVIAWFVKKNRVGDFIICILLFSICLPWFTSVFF